MADKSRYVDLIGDATRQKRRRREESHVVAKTVFDEPEEPQPERRLSNWPPARFAKWRLENITPWKMKVKGWTYKDWT
ncbi:hypothetical protein [Bradyrhizobium sp. Tv2a-2]|jgi:hypothetical protein|uniref:hypothetical protein n=1 Tax=Bradyrhizobium sp. Tv2a-2 TaxID=113395 RepID=UPI000401FA22|nr:hypothetical protein [Bradyrhizobium sp. Tv2a-2]